MPQRVSDTVCDPVDLVVRVKGIELFTGRDGQKLEQQLTRPAAVIVPVSGSGELIMGTARRGLRQDHIYTCPPEGTFGIQTEPGGELSVYIVRVDLLRVYAEGNDKYAVDVPLPAFSADEGEISVQPAGRAVSLCRDIMEQLGSADGLCRWQAQWKGAELIYLMLSAKGEALGGGTAAALQRSKAYMDHRYGEDIALERLAAIAELSPKYYADLFKKTYGLSAFDYLTQVRMNQAKRLMLQTELRLRDIAHEVGYDDEFYFSRKFKKTFGMPPSAYLKKHSRKVAVYGNIALTGFLLPLDIVPYAAPLHPKWTGYYCDRFGIDIAVHLDAYRNNAYKQTNLDKLAQAKPDLIVVNPGLEAWEMAELEKIAPLLVMPDDREGWRRKLLWLADRLEARKEARQWMANFDRKVREKRERVQRSFGRGRVLVVKLLKDQLYAHNCFGFDSLLYKELELRRAFPDEAMQYNCPIAPEELNRIEAERVLLLVCKETETLAHWKELQHSIGWMSLRPVRDNRLRLVSSEPWREYSAIALERMLDEVEGLFF